MSKSAIILITNASAHTGSAKPMLLARVRGTALLTWLTAALTRRGINRYFLVCQERFLNEAALCFPEDCDVTLCPDRQAAEPLHVFLSGAQEQEEQILMIAGPCVCLPSALQQADAERATCACRIPRSALMRALDEADFSFHRFLLSRRIACTEHDGFYAVSTPEELQRRAGDMVQAHLAELSRQGVEIWDTQHCYVDPQARVGAGTVLMPGAILRGYTVIGRECVIGPNVLLENVHIGNGCHVNTSQICDCVLGSDCAVGAFSSLQYGCRFGNRVRIGSACSFSAVSLGDGTHVGAGCTLRDLTVGRSCHIGAGCITSAHAPDASGTITIADDTVIGGGVTLAGAITMGRSSAAAAGAILTAPIPAQMLAASRSKTILRKDWVLHRDTSNN